MQQDESNRRQEEQGLLAPIDVVAAQTQLANFEVSAYTRANSADQRRECAEDADAAGSHRSPLWSSALIPTTPAERNAAAHSAAGRRRRSAGQPAGDSRR